MIPRFLVRARSGRSWVGLVNGGVHAAGGNFQTFDELPGPFDGFLFEIVAEAPVAEHLEERVVVGVEADVVEVVVFAPGADALLRIGGATGPCRGRRSPCRGR